MLAATQGRVQRRIFELATSQSKRVDRNFFPIALQVHGIQQPLEPYIGREPDAVAPKLTREKGWHHATVSWLSKPVRGG